MSHRLVFVLGMCAISAASGAAEIEPKRFSDGVRPRAVYSERTLQVTFDIDRSFKPDRVVAFTAKARPYHRSGGPPEARASLEETPAQIELVLTRDDGDTFTDRVEIRGLCLAHGPDYKPHARGDTLRVHQDTITIELPDLHGLEGISLAIHDPGPAPGRLQRIDIGKDTLDAARFRQAGGSLEWTDLESSRHELRPGARPTPVASPTPAGTPPLPAATPTPGAALRNLSRWPEEFGEPVYEYIGASGPLDERINVVMLPDGYTRDDRTAMRRDAETLASAYLSHSPLAQYSEFFNFVLVPLYSAASGVTQEDCGVEVDTALYVRFPQVRSRCADQANRCMSAMPGASSDAWIANRDEALMRAPAFSSDKDIAIILANSGRYGACYTTVVYVTGHHPDTAGLVLHETGHRLAGLAEEYGGWPSCGAPSGPNASSSAAVGWAEWRDVLRHPRKQANGYDECFRPSRECRMNTVSASFCVVCREALALSVFSNGRIADTAPVRSATPAAQVSIPAGSSVQFGLVTRLPLTAAGPTMVKWIVTAAGTATPVATAVGVESFTHTFGSAGSFEVQAEVVAAREFIRRTGACRDVQQWAVTVAAAP